jgi:acyl-coenzyme A thioesterase PaaI-like protein
MRVAIELGDPGDPRRTALAGLAEAVRRLSDAVATTAADTTALTSAEAEVRRVVAVLDAEHSDDPYSGLMIPRPDRNDPSEILPLSPIVGAFSPVRPEVRLRIVDGRVTGTARLERKHVGPPGFAHGGIGALLADQLVACTQIALGVQGVTRTLSVRYRRPLPLHTELSLDAGAALDGDRVHARGTISAGDTVCLQIEAELAVRDTRSLRT